MSNDKEMTLMMRIRANGAEAKTALKAITKEVEALGKSAKAAFKDVGAIGGFVFAPLRMATTAAATLAGGLVAVGSAAIYAAAAEEKLLARLTAVAGSATDGKTALDKFNTIARHSGFKTEDLAEAAIIMKQYGFNSRAALIAVGKAARVAGVDVQTLAIQTMALQARGLKRFGIEMDEGSDAPVIRFRNNAGKIVQIATRSADEARKKMLEIYTLKFGTNISPNTFSAYIQMLKSNLTQMWERLGEPMLKPAKRFIDYISGGLTKAIEEGKIDEWGKKAGQFLEVAAVNLMASFQTMGDIWKSIRDDMTGGQFLHSITEVLRASAQIAAIGFVSYLVAMKDIFAGLGRIIGAVLMESVLNLPLPGMDAVRRKGVARALAGMSEAQATAQGIDPQFAGRADRLMSPERRKELDADINDFIRGLSPEKAASLATQGFNASDMFESGLNEFKDKLPALAANTAESMKQVLKDLSKSVTPDLGFVPENRFSIYKEQQLRAMAMQGRERVTARFTQLQPVDPNNPLIQKPVSFDRTVDADAGRFKVNQAIPGGGVIINIQNMNSFTTDAGRMAREVIGHSQKARAVQAVQ